MRALRAHLGPISALALAVLVGAASLALLLAGATARAADFSSAVWEPLSQGDGIEVFRWSSPDSPLFAFKAEAIVDAPIERVATVLVDTPRRHEWVPSLIEARIVRTISKYERVEYTAIKTPPFTKDRDFVLHGRAEYVPATKELVLHFSSVDDPAAPPTDRIRGRILDSRYLLRPEGPNRTFVEYRVHVDPMGSVPKWLVNATQKKIPRRTIEALREQVNRPDIVINPEVTILLSPRK